MELSRCSPLSRPAVTRRFRIKGTEVWRDNTYCWWRMKPWQLLLWKGRSGRRVVIDEGGSLGRFRVGRS